jgi:uncharacterized membrane protein YvlD (DUF360 family)
MILPHWAIHKVCFTEYGNAQLKHSSLYVVYAISFGLIQAMIRPFLLSTFGKTLKLQTRGRFRLHKNHINTIKKYNTVVM